MLPFCGTSYLFIRECYESAYRYLLEQDDMRRPDNLHHDGRLKGEKGIVISGQPGIGKTCFLAYAWIERMLAGKPTILQIGGASNHINVMFDKGAVRLISVGDDAFCNPEVWMLCDSTPGGVVDMPNSLECYLVVASSPQESNFKTIRKVLSLKYMGPWSLEELLSLR